MPPDYDAVTDKHAKTPPTFWPTRKRACRRSSPSKNWRACPEQPQGPDRTCSVDFLFRNKMKSDSPVATLQLMAGSVRSVVCTGDNALTGIFMGRMCGIVDKGYDILLGNLSSDGELEWHEPDIVDGPVLT